MAKYCVCDLCECKIDGEPITVEFKDGTHPHNGSTMYKTCDVCPVCASKISELKCSRELDDVCEELFKPTVYPHG